MLPTELRSPPVVRLLTLLAFACTMGCALVQPPLTSPAQGGGTWTELSSGRFDLTTDLPREGALEALGALEGIYDLFADVAYRALRVRDGRIHVVLFRREKDYRVLGVKGSDAYFTPMLDNDPEPEPTAVMFGGLSESNRLVFQHELAHAFMRRALAHIPVWLGEGMAEYHSTLVAEDGEAVLGKVPPSKIFTTATDWGYAPPGASYYAIPVGAVPTVRELLGATPDMFYAARFSSEREPTRDEQKRQRAYYAGAWALVHLLLNRNDLYRRCFADFLDALARGTKPRAAWEQSFADVDQDTLQRDFAAYLLRDSRMARVRSYKPRPPPPPMRERTLSDPEVHLLWARLSDWNHQGAVRARRHLDDALLGAPASVDVHFWRARFFLARGDDAAAESELLSALRVKPTEPRFLLTWVQLEAQKATHGTGGLRAIDAAASRLADVATTATELDAVAFVRAVVERPDDGLPFAERALQAEPNCWRCLDTYAVLLAAKGRHDEAIAAQARALELLPEERRAAPLLDRLRKYEAAARAKAPPAASGPGPTR